jgi:hypothetical protein
MENRPNSLSKIWEVKPENTHFPKAFLAVQHAPVAFVFIYRSPTYHVHDYCNQFQHCGPTVHPSKQCVWATPWFLGVGWDWVHLVRRPLFGLLYQPRISYDDKCGTVGGIRIGREDRSTRRKPAPVPLCPSQTLMTWPGLEPGVSRCGKPSTTAWALTRPSCCTVLHRTAQYWQSRGKPQASNISFI